MLVFLVPGGYSIDGWVFQYLVVMMGVFATLAWIGSLIDNLLLTYLLGEFLYIFTCSTEMLHAFTI